MLTDCEFILDWSSHITELENVGSLNNSVLEISDWLTKCSLNNELLDVVTCLRKLSEQRLKFSLYKAKLLRKLCSISVCIQNLLQNFLCI